MRKLWLVLLAIVVVVTFLVAPIVAAANTGPPLDGNGGYVVTRAGTLELNQGIVAQAGIEVRRQLVALVALLGCIAVIANLKRVRRSAAGPPIGLTDGGWSLSSA